MKIKKISVASFGNIKDRNFFLSDGLNVIYGNNESGKSTLFAFIRYMLYSFHGRKTSSSLTQEEKYMPWDNTSACGSMDFETMGQTYTVSRSAGIKKEGKVINSVTGESSFDGSPLGEQIYSLNESAFLRTYFLSSLSGSFTCDRGDDILKRLSNLSGNCDENFSHDEIGTKINSDIKRTTKDIDEKIAEISVLKERLNLLDELSEKKDTLTEKLGNINLVKEQNTDDTEKPQKKENNDKLKEKYETSKSNQLQRILIFAVLLVCTTILFVANAVPFEVVFCGYGLSLLSLLFVVIGAIRNSGLKKRILRSEKYARDYKIDVKDADFSTDDEKSRILKELGAVESKIDEEYSYDDICSEINCLEQDKSELENKLKVFYKARDILDVSYNQMKNVFAPELNKRASEIFAGLTGNKYDDVIVTDSFEIKIKEAYEYKSSLYYSRATLELMYISLRLALCDILEKEEKHTIFLDDCFSALDDERVKIALKFLADYSSGERQVVFTTCHGRELEILSATEGVNVINL